MKSSQKEESQKALYQVCVSGTEVGWFACLDIAKNVSLYRVKWASFEFDLFEG